MATYLIFFGSSDGFTYLPFDESGKVLNFDRLYSDFDVLETSKFIIDNTNNKPVLAKYFFKNKGKQHSLLKLYGYGQSAISSRVEGSNIGVAILSDQDITLNQTNLGFLQTFFNHFTELCLSNKKFKNKTFENEAFAIYDAFVKQYGFNSFIHESFTENFIYKSITEGYQLPSFKEEYFKVVNNLIEHTYFTTDQGHLERIYKRWQGTFRAFVFQKDKFISLKELEENERKQQELISAQKHKEQNRKGNTDTIASQLSTQNLALEQRLNNATKAYQNLEKKSRIFFIISLIVFVLLLGLNLIQFFNSSEVESKVTNDNNYKYQFDNFNELEKTYLDSLLIDTNKILILNPLLKADYQFMTRKYDSISSSDLIQKIRQFNSAEYSKIDTNFTKSINNQ